MSVRLPEGDFDSLLVTASANVRYLTGFTGSAGCALITPRQRYLFTDFRYETQAAREAGGFRVEIIAGELLAGVCRFAMDRRLKLGVLGYDAVHLSQRGFAAIKKQLKGVRMADAAGAVEALRQAKTAAEVRRIRKAAAIADRALTRLSRARVSGRSELELAWMLETSMREAGSGPLPFEVIVASGPHSAMPHARPGKRRLREGDLLLVDMGAEWQGYGCDISRTFAVGRLAPALEKIYEEVRKAQALGVEAAVAGRTGAEVDAAARRQIDAAGFGDRFRHAAGHGVGLETHEAPSISPLAGAGLTPGMVITVEPGIYLPGRGGVRIEDTVLVGSRKATRLTGFPRELRILR